MLEKKKSLAKTNECFLRSLDPAENSERGAHTHTTQAHARTCMHEGGWGWGGVSWLMQSTEYRQEKKRTKSMLDELAGPLANPSAAAFFTPFLSNSLSLSLPRSLSLVLSAFFP